MLEQIEESFQEIQTNLTNLKNTLNDYLESSDINKSLPENIVNAVSSWLGLDLNSDEAVSTFANDIDKLISGLGFNNNFVYNPNYTSNPDNRKAITYVYTIGRRKNDGTIYFTENFNSNKLNDFGNYTFSGVIFHELTHKILDTKDFRTYDVGDMRQLSNEQKYQHANSWMYAYEAIFKGGII